MKYISVTIRDTLLTVGIWMLVPVGDGQKRVSDDVLNLPKFRSWRPWGCSDLPFKCGWITGIVCPIDSWQFQQSIYYACLGDP